MEFVFRKLYPPKSVVPQPGEIYLLPLGQRTDLASLVYEEGPEALLKGPGPYERIVIDGDAKFDDMLAASFLERRLKGQSLGPGCEPFGRYAGLLRAGLRPAKFPFENSLEGIYLAIRCNAEKHLTDPETSRAFLEDWSRLAEVIFRAAELESDPFTTPLVHLLADASQAMMMQSINAFARPAAAELGADFSREQRYLTEDLEVYREDVAHGEKWQAKLPGGPPGSPGLLLRQPQSLLFKYWTRSQCAPPAGGPYPFVAVTFWHGQWVFSSDPVHKISLKGLAEMLQAAEEKKDPQRARENPWFDGAPTNYQVVASPRPGSVLPDDTVLTMVRKWCRAYPAGATPKGRRYVAAVVGICLVAVLALALAFPASGPKPVLKIHNVFVLSIGVSKYQKLSNLPSAVRDAEQVQEAFKKLEGTKLCKFVDTKMLENFQATKTNILEGGLDAWLLNEKRVTSKSLVVITFSGHGLVDHNLGYVFAPHDYDPRSPRSGISLFDLQPSLRKLGCPAVVLLDTCHSGAAEDDENNDPQNVQKIVKKIIDSMSSPYGLAVLMACDRNEKANESRSWKQGAFTLAFLEGMDGKPRYENPKLAPVVLPAPNADGIVTLNEMTRYIQERVEQLSSEVSIPKNRQQRVGAYATGLEVRQIPMTLRTMEEKAAPESKK